jgi:hypothetical protein
MEFQVLCRDLAFDWDLYGAFGEERGLRECCVDGFGGFFEVVEVILIDTDENFESVGFVFGERCAGEDGHFSDAGLVDVAEGVDAFVVVSRDDFEGIAVAEGSFASDSHAAVEVVGGAFAAFAHGDVDVFEVFERESWTEVANAQFGIERSGEGDFEGSGLSDELVGVCSVSPIFSEDGSEFVAVELASEKMEKVSEVFGFDLVGVGFGDADFLDWLFLGEDHEGLRQKFLGFRFLGFWEIGEDIRLFLEFWVGFGVW